MAKNKDEEELDIEIPGEEDENVGEGAPKKKKRKKSKEERIAERKVVFWTLLIVLIITVGFWLTPIVKSIFKGEPLVIETDQKTDSKPSVAKPENKNYIEITL